MGNERRSLRPKGSDKTLDCCIWFGIKIKKFFSKILSRKKEGIEEHTVAKKIPKGVRNYCPV